jgi:hypothetical protein
MPFYTAEKFIKTIKGKGYFHPRTGYEDPEGE